MGDQIVGQWKAINIAINHHRHGPGGIVVIGRIMHAGNDRTTQSIEAVPPVVGEIEIIGLLGMQVGRIRMDVAPICTSWLAIDTAKLAGQIGAIVRRVGPLDIRG